VWAINIDNFSDILLILQLDNLVVITWQL